MNDNSTYGIEADGPIDYGYPAETCGDLAECHGDGPCPVHTTTIVTATRKPCQIVGTATATVTANDATYDEVLDAGLAALRETRQSLWGYGVRGATRGTEGLTGTFTVYADRD